MTDQAQLLRNLVNQTACYIPRTVAVTSGKGGVGKTNIAINLALALINLKQKVALLDGDLGLANADLLLGVYPKYTLVDIVNGKRELRDIIIEGPQGLKVIAGSSGVYELANMNQMGLDRLISAAVHLNQGLDFLIVDTSAGLARSVIRVIEAVNEVLVVATSEPSSIADAYGLIKTIIQREPEKEIVIIANMVRSPNEGLLVWQKINLMTTRFLRREVKYGGSVLYDHKVVAAVRSQQAFILAYPGSIASRSVKTAAENLLTKNYLSADPVTANRQLFFGRDTFAN
ncbi:MAG TPA: MinD/ParA family protein [Firmicutes bacterium]|nr:MinD/ParA family protein [Bacillota bacterium]